MKRAVSSALIAALLGSSALATSAMAQPVGDALSSDVLNINGASVPYRAQVTAMPVTGADASTGTIVTTTYLRTDVDTANRPVVFIFNGGPGASTTPLHFGAFGPMRRFGEGNSQYLLLNPHSLLDTADLVFIDPVGTGYSRPDGDSRAFWSRTGDARSVADVIQTWLEQHSRQGSPRYVLGQSYGTIRAAELTRVAPDLHLDGILLFALVPGERDGPLAAMASLPSYVSAACYHAKIDCAGRTPEQVYDDAVQFARTDYVTALIQGGALPQPQKAAMAQRLSQMTGLPAPLWLQNDLRIDNATFMFNLLAEDGLRSGQLDARATDSLAAPSRQPPYDDPGLSYAPETGARALAQGDNAFRALDGGNVVDAYYAQVLGYQASDKYEALNLRVNAAWDHEGFKDAMPYLATAMKRDPSMRVFWSAGYYDLSTPAYGARYTLDQAGIPADRLTAAYFASGHSVFVEERNLQALTKAVRDFIRP